MTDIASTKPSPSRLVLLFEGGSAQFGLLAIVVALWIVFSFLAPGFLSRFNLNSLGRSLAIDIVVGFSQMAALATGGINLSVGAIGVCALMATGWLLQVAGLPIPVAIFGGLALGALQGWINGFAIARSGVNSFIVTLATSSLFAGGMLIVTRAAPFNALPSALSAFGTGNIGGAPNLLFVAAGIGVALFVLFGFSLAGRQILATGANPRAAAMSGVPVNRVIMLAHALSGLLAAAAGVMLLAKLGAALPSVAGDEWLLPSFLGPVLGGSLLSGGFVSVIGTMIGATLVTTIRSGLLVLQVGNFWLQLFLGIVLLFAVMIERYRSVVAARRAVARQ